jgi:3-hydroxyacyl-CoA dehydrogenase
MRPGHWAILEDVSIKRALFTPLEAIVPPDPIVATNTSSLSVSGLARELDCAS